MHNFLKLFLLTACLTLVACNQTTQKADDSSQNEQPEAKIEAEMPDPLTNEGVIDTPSPIDNPEPPMVDEFLGVEEFSVSEVQSALNNFGMKDEPQFSNCAYRAIQDCGNQMVQQKVQEEKDPSACDLLEEGPAEACKDNLWRQLSSMEKDISLCDKIGNDFGKHDCQNAFHVSAAVEAKDPALCEKIKPYVDSTLQNPVADIPAGEGEEVPAPIEIIEPNDYLLEDCKQQIKFAIEFEEIEASFEDPIIEAPVIEEPPALEEIAVPEPPTPEVTPVVEEELAAPSLEELAQ